MRARIDVRATRAALLAGRAALLAACAALLVRPAGAHGQGDGIDGRSRGTARDDAEIGLHGLGLDLSLADGSGLNAVGQNYRNELSATIEPRWAAGRVLFGDGTRLGKLALSGKFVVTRALAGTGDENFGPEARGGPLAPCSDVTPSSDGGVVNPRQVRRCNPASNARRTDYSDLVLAAALPRFATVPRARIDVSGGLRVTLPVSAQSRFQTLRLSLAATGRLGRSFRDGKLRLGYTLGVTKNFHAWSTPGLSPGPGSGAAEIGGNTAGGLAGVGISNFYADPARAGTGGMSTSHALSSTLGADVAIAEAWSAGARYGWIDGFSYPHRCAVDVAGQAVDTCATGAAVAAASGSEVERRGHRRAQVLSAGVTFAPRAWIELSLSWLTLSPREKPDGSYRQGFVSTDYNAFSTLVLGATFSVERWLARRTAPAPVVAAARLSGQRT